jgi:uncharacterized membrane protein
VDKEYVDTTIQRWCRFFLWTFSTLFLFCYPFAVIGIAFDVQPPFSLAWAGSFLLFLEGFLLIVATLYLYTWRRAILASVSVIFFSYLAETLGVQSAFPFGHYAYTGVLLPPLPGSVPLAVMFAWVLIVFGAYGIVTYRNHTHPADEEASHTEGRRALPFRSALLAALLATLLDLAIEPVAFHIVHYWRWSQPGPFAYYGVPAANFIAWFVLSFLFYLLVDFILYPVITRTEPSKALWHKYSSFYRGSLTHRLASLAPPILFLCSLFMFGLVDLTHTYYWGAFAALLALILTALLLSFSLSPTTLSPFIRDRR